jgi:hypothetical protein
LATTMTTTTTMLMMLGPLVIESNPCTDKCGH